MNELLRLLIFAIICPAFKRWSSAKQQEYSFLLWIGPSSHTKSCSSQLSGMNHTVSFRLFLCQLIEPAASRALLNVSGGYRKQRDEEQGEPVLYLQDLPWSLIPASSAGIRLCLSDHRCLRRDAEQQKHQLFLFSTIIVHCGTENWDVTSS